MIKYPIYANAAGMYFLNFIWSLPYMNLWERGKNNYKTLNKIYHLPVPFWVIFGGENGGFPSSCLRFSLEYQWKMDQSSEMCGWQLATVHLQRCIMCLWCPKLPISGNWGQNSALPKSWHFLSKHAS